jgi:DNA repair photolyase
MSQPALFGGWDGTQAPLKEKKEVRHFELPCKSILNYTNTCRMPDTYTLNPYRGCEFGCVYCYARYTHEFMDLDWDEFERKIFVKRGAARTLLRTLDENRLRGKHIAIGTATDPYQPGEVTFQVTRQLLEVFSRVKGMSLSVTTKSALVRRDIDLFRKISAANDFRVNVSLISLDGRLLRAIEPKASSPTARLRALKALSEAGIRTGILMMPILPGLTDSLAHLEGVIRLARRSGASFLHPRVLFLRESARQVFYRFIRKEHPELYGRYLADFGKRVYAGERYQGRITGLVEELKRKYGFPEEPVESAAIPYAPQGVLWPEAEGLHPFRPRRGETGHLRIGTQGPEGAFEP